MVKIFLLSHQVILLQHNKQMQANKKVLIILSSVDSITLQSGKSVETGFFLLELAAPLRKILNAGLDVVFANPLGNKPHMDPMSNSSMWYLGSSSQLQEDIDLLNRMRLEKSFDAPRTLDSITDQELTQQFIGVFIPGGHAPVMDLGNNPHVSRILKHCHMFQKPIGSICHGPVALLSAVDPFPNEWIFKGYKMTCYSNMEETLNEWLWWDKIPGKVEDRLKQYGAQMIETFPLGRQVTVDRELITAQGPTSAYQFGDEYVNHLVRFSQGTPS